MDNKDAIKLVLQCVPELGSFTLTADKINDFDDYWYITRLDEDGETFVGGYAYVVHIETGAIFAVPGAMPPHFNLRSVVEDDAKEITQF